MRYLDVLVMGVLLWKSYYSKAKYADLTVSWFAGSDCHEVHVPNAESGEEPSSSSLLPISKRKDIINIIIIIIIIQIKNNLPKIIWNKFYFELRLLGIVTKFTWFMSRDSRLFTRFQSRDRQYYHMLPDPFSVLIDAMSLLKP
jgi:hypothetical protein